MNLNKDDVAELNALLKNESLELPAFRREVNRNGGNYAWLQKHILRSNPQIGARLRELLKLPEAN